MPLLIPLIPFRLGPIVITRAMRIALALTRRISSGLVERFVGLVTGFDAEILSAIVAEVVARHRSGRRAGAVVASEDRPIAICQRRVVTRRSTEPDAGPSSCASQLPMPERLGEDA